MPYFTNWFAANKAEEAKINSNTASSTAKLDAHQARKSTSSAVSNLARSMTQGSKAAAKTVEDKTARTANDITRAGKDTAHDTAEQATRDNTHSAIGSTEQTTSSTEQAAKEEAHTVADTTAPVAEDVTQGATDEIERTVSNVEQTTIPTADTPVNKVKSGRPKMSSHDSVGDKFKHALHLDHKQHHAHASTGHRSS